MCITQREWRSLMNDWSGLVALLPNPFSSLISIIAGLFWKSITYNQLLFESIFVLLLKDKELSEDNLCDSFVRNLMPDAWNNVTWNSASSPTSCALQTLHRYVHLLNSKCCRLRSQCEHEGSLLKRKKVSVFTDWAQLNFSNWKTNDITKGCYGLLKNKKDDADFGLNNSWYFFLFQWFSKIWNSEFWWWHFKSPM